MQVELVESCNSFFTCFPDAWVNFFGTLLGALIGGLISGYVAWMVATKSLKKQHLLDIEGFRIIFEKNKLNFNKLEHHFNFMMNKGISDELKKEEAKQISNTAGDILNSFNTTSTIIPAVYLREFDDFKMHLQELGNIYRNEKYLSNRMNQDNFIGTFKIASPIDSFKIYQATKERILKKIEL